MARKITCPHCNAETYDTPSCGRCGGPLRSQDKPESEKKILAELIHKSGMLERAEQVQKTLFNVVLATFQAVRKADGVELASTRIVVQRDRRQYVYTSRGTEPVKRGAGQYELGKIMLAGKGKSEEYGCLICEVSETPFTVTFVFPDSESFDRDLVVHPEPEVRRRAFEEALNAFNLRTSDNQLGGALLQVRLICTDPIKLVRCQNAIDSQSGLAAAEPSGPQVQDPDRPWYQQAWDWVCGKKIVKETLRTKKITMANLYKMIRYELAEAIGNSVRNFQVQAFYDKEDSNRARLHAFIKEYMEKTLDSYGLQIVDVVAFQFRSPDYEEFLKRRGDITMQRKDLENDLGAANIRRVKRDLDHKEFEHAEEVEEKKDHLTLERRARLGEKEAEVAAEEAKRADQLALDNQTRQIAREKQRIEYERERRIADEGLDDERQHKKALRALEYQAQLQIQQAKVIQEMHDAEHRRRLEAIKLIAGCPPEQQFLLAMQYNPELQQAFIAVQQAQSQQDKLNMAQHFQGQIQAIYGKQSEQTHALLTEAAKQLGLVASAKHGGQRPPPHHVVVEQLPPPASPEQRDPG